MFVYNYKINGGKALKIIIILLSLFMLIVFSISIYRIFFSSRKFKVNDEQKAQDIIEIKPENYTDILQAVHNQLDEYIGLKISFTGYVYRLFDFDDNEFVIARDMFINENKTQTVVVGFLCRYKNTKDFEEKTWVNITGIIEKGKYHNEEIPIIKIEKMEQCQKANDEFVDMPKDTYVPTSGIF